MRTWAIVEGSAGKLCILPMDMIMQDREKCMINIYKAVKCHGLLEAVKKLHEYEAAEKALDEKEKSKDD